jgi:hypothetical protein
LFAELPLDGRTVGLGSAAAELLDKKIVHRCAAKLLFNHTKARGQRNEVSTHLTLLDAYKRPCYLFHCLQG